MDKFIPPLTVLFIYHPRTKIVENSTEETLIQHIKDEIQKLETNEQTKRAVEETLIKYVKDEIQKLETTKIVKDATAEILVKHIHNELSNFKPSGIEKGLIEPLAKMLSRDEEKPFSRSINLPVFFYTAKGDGIPPAIPVVEGKTVIFSFIDKNIVGNKEWSAYIKKIVTSENNFIIHTIALDETALNLKGYCKGVEFIRAFDFEEEHKKDYIFIEMAHAINRQIPKSDEGEKIQLFLSHAKKNQIGVKIAKALKIFIENDTTMSCFFDVNDILPGDKFDSAIIENIKKSTVIAIHTDIYSSRYYCQREILCAKQENRPIIAVAALEKFEDRHFPFASNIPSVHIQHIATSPCDRDLFEIIKIASIETIRHNYVQQLLTVYELLEWINKPDLKLTRPPEISDIKKIFDTQKESIQNTKDEVKRFVYPDPPVYEEETAFLKKLNIKADTPLTSDVWGLEGKKVGVSISDPSLEELLKIGQNKTHLNVLSQEMARYLLCNKITLIYGGDLREGGFTNFICQEVRALQSMLNNDNLRLYNYLAWPIYRKDPEKTTTWLAENADVLEYKNVDPPSDILDLIPHIEQYLDPIGAQNRFVWSRCLTKMRKQMIIKSDNLKDKKEETKTGCDVRICAGGKLFGYTGMISGVLEEILIAEKQNLPLYLVGGFGGITAKVCEAIKTGKLPEELTLDWQITNNKELQETREFTKIRDKQYFDEISKFYDSTLLETLNNLKLNNGLSKEDNERLFTSQYVDEIVFLILKGLNSVFNKMDYLIGTYPALKLLKDDVSATPAAIVVDDEKNVEYNRTMLSIELLTLVFNGGWKNYDRFTERQEPHNKLSKESFDEIRNYTINIIKNEADLNAMYAYLIITGVDKVKNFVNKIKSKLEAKPADYVALLHLCLTDFPDLSPTFSGLDDNYKQLILNGLKTMFNMQQRMQSEKMPKQLEPIANIDKLNFDFYLLHTLYDIGGAEGHVSRQGSTIIDKTFWNNFKTAKQQLEKIKTDGEVNQTYNGFLQTLLEYETMKADLVGNSVQKKKTKASITSLKKSQSGSEYCLFSKKTRVGGTCQGGSNCIPTGSERCLFSKKIQNYVCSKILNAKGIRYIERLGGGLCGSQVFRIDVDSSDNSGWHIVKLSTKDIGATFSEEEKLKCQSIQYSGSYADDHFVNSHVFSPKDLQLIICNQGLQTRKWSKELCSLELDQKIEYVKNISYDLLAKWNSKTAESSKIASFFVTLLNKRIKVNGKFKPLVEKLLKDPQAKKIWFPFANAFYPNPYYYITNLSDLVEKINNDRPVNFITGKSHGDVHAQNIICNTAESALDYVIIDYTFYEPKSFVLYDNAVLEIDGYYRILKDETADVWVKELPRLLKKQVTEKLGENLKYNRELSAFRDAVCSGISMWINDKDNNRKGNFDNIGVQFACARIAAGIKYFCSPFMESYTHEVLMLYYIAICMKNLFDLTKPAEGSDDSFTELREYNLKKVN